MDRKEELKDHPSLSIYEELNSLQDKLSESFRKTYDRSLPFNEMVFDRFDRAKKLGWGEGSSIYESSCVFGDVKVGRNCWIGPFTIIDGSGGLEIGDRVTISAAVHIYSHENVKQTLTDGKLPIERTGVKISDRVYIGPHSIVSMGVQIGENSVIACNSFVNSDVPPNTIVGGNPARVLGKVIIDGDNVKFDYSDR